MKHTTRVVSTALLFVLASLFGCTKDEMADRPQNRMVLKGPVGTDVQFNYGIIKGFLNPVPDFAAIKVRNLREGTSMPYYPEPDGTIHINTVLTGTYDLYVYYEFRLPEYRYENMIVVRDVSVIGGEVTSIGEVYLPHSH